MGLYGNPSEETFITPTTLRKVRLAVYRKRQFPATGNQHNFLEFMQNLIPFMSGPKNASIYRGTFEPRHEIQSESSSKE